MRPQMGNNPAADVPRWYAIHTNSKQEERANSNLRAWGVETLNPLLKERTVNQYTGKPSYVVKALFPRYIFAQFVARDLLHKVCFTRGVYNVVSFGDHPSPVDDEIIDYIQMRID